MKNVSKKMVGGVVAVIAAVIVIAVTAVLTLRIDAAEAQQIALDQAGGGEIVESEVSREGLVNEYSYMVVNGDQWYQIEISGFGNIEEMESGQGDSWRY